MWTRHIALDEHDLSDQRVYSDNLGIRRVENCICPDGIQRTARTTALTPDTFFSQPARVYKKGKSVSGYITFETIEGLSTETPDDPGVWKFVPYTYGKNYYLFAED